LKKQEKTAKPCFKQRKKLSRYIQSTNAMFEIWQMLAAVSAGIRAYTDWRGLGTKSLKWVKRNSDFELALKIVCHGGCQQPGA
jgi:hypothetical protein